jgi:hypothetical protein
MRITKSVAYENGWRRLVCSLSAGHQCWFNYGLRVTPFPHTTSPEIRFKMY